MLRILQIALSAVGGLLIVPIAVNVGTSGDAPGWLRPYVGWLWPVAIGCVASVIALEIWDKVRVPRTAISARRPHDPRNVPLALAQVARYVEERRRGSLAEQVRVTLTLDERPAAVRQPWHLVRRLTGEEILLAADFSIGGVFERMDESMLLLGAPGAGKTTQLLDLAAELLALAGAAAPAQRRIPVVLDLAEWSRSGRRPFALGRGTDRGPRDFVGWLLAGLRDRYHIPEAIGRAWLTQNRFTFLLDGLDEVREADRERCVEEINNLQSEWRVTRLAVCSREADYDRLAVRLRLQGAAVIRPLTRKQVTTYLAETNPRLVDALGSDGKLWELLTTPLMLNIMTLAQADRTWSTLSQDPDPAVRRRLVFDAYVTEVLARRRAHERGDPERTLRAMRMLAVASARLDSGVRVVPLDPRTAERALDTSVHAVKLYWMLPASAAIGALVSAVTMGVQFSAAAGIVPALGALFALTLGSDRLPRPTTAVKVGALLRYLIAVATVASGLVLGLSWLVTLPRSSTAVAAVAFGLALAQAAGMWLLLREGFTEWWFLLAIVAAGAAVAIAVLLLGAPPAALRGWAVGCAQGFPLMILFLLGDFRPDARRSGPAGRRVLAIQTRIFTAVAVAAPIALADSWVSPFWLPLTGWLVGLAYAYLPGGIAGIFLVGPLSRVAIAIAGKPLPWRAGFLRFAADRSLLIHSDGEYRFVHLLIRDHLARCDPARLAAAVLRRRAELDPVPARA